MFDKILPTILEFEGGYVNHPSDPGGATNKGVTQATYDRYRRKLGQPTQDVREILFTEVKQIYFDYWRAASCEQITKTHPLTSAVLFDCAINSGPRQAIRILQRSVEVKPVDGIVGRITLSAVLSSNDLATALKYLDLRTDFFISIVEKKPSQIVFLRGWLRRVSHLRKLIYEWSR